MTGVNQRKQDREFECYKVTDRALSLCPGAKVHPPGVSEKAWASFRGNVADRLRLLPFLHSLCSEDLHWFDLVYLHRCHISQINRFQKSKAITFLHSGVKLHIN